MADRRVSCGLNEVSNASTAIFLKGHSKEFNGSTVSNIQYPFNQTGKEYLSVEFHLTFFL